MTLTFRFVPIFIAAVSCALFVSCGDDPAPPMGPYVPPSYRAELQSLNADFRLVCGAGSKDLYAMGSVILHHDGTAWNTIQPPDGLTREVYLALGFEDGTLLVSDGRNVFVRANGSWSTRADFPHSPQDLWGTSSNDFYALTWDSLYHVDGTTWKPTTLPKAYEIEDIAGDQEGELVACGSYGRIDRFHGTGWVSSYIDSMLHFREAAVTSTGRLFVLSQVGFLYEIVNSTPVPIADSQLYSPILCTDGEAVFLAGREPYSPPGSYAIRQLNNNVLQDVSSGAGDLHAFWAGHGNLIAGGADGFVWCGNASGGSRAPYQAGGPIYSMALIDGSIYTIGEDAYRYDNGQWTDLNKGYLTRLAAWDIDGRTPNNIYAIGDEMVLHFDGSKWTWVNSALNTSPSAIWVEPSGEVIAVDGGAVLEYDDMEWTKTTLPVSSGFGFADVIGVNGLIVAVGDEGLIAMRRNGEWYISPPPTNDPLVALWAHDERHIYAASLWGYELCVFNGQSWHAMPVLGVQLDRVVDMWGSSPTNLFVMDQDGRLAHFDGHDWSPEERVFSTGMNAIRGNGPELLVGGYSGSASYRR